MVRVIGLISGTSTDGIDAALVEISTTTVDVTIDLTINLLAGATYPYPDPLRQEILAVASGKPLSIAELAALDDAIAHQFAQAAFLIQSNHLPVDLIGSHGQTVYHRPPRRGSRETTLSSPFPPPPLGCSLQLGRGALIAHLTGITTVSNFRAADIAVGGQGAPLVPPVDAWLLSHPTYNRCVQNIGGIGNVTYLPARGESPPSLPNFLSKVRGWDTGPGNTLLDLAVQHVSKGAKTFDQDGAWAAQGTPCQTLVQQWLHQDFFQQAPPKSTGREEFGQYYLSNCLADAVNHDLSDADLLATLTELTAASIVHSYCTFLPQMPDQVLLCGGGSHNRYLKQRLQAKLGSTLVCTTDDMGLSVDYKEAIAFAVLAYWRSKGIPGNLPEVTGAWQPVLLGEIYPGNQNSA
jgi:anhydro-N-acetylmuramic acid kinase